MVPHAARLRASARVWKRSSTLSVATQTFGSAASGVAARMTMGEDVPLVAEDPRHSGARVRCILRTVEANIRISTGAVLVLQAGPVFESRLQSGVVMGYKSETRSASAACSLRHAEHATFLGRAPLAAERSMFPNTPRVQLQVGSWRRGLTNSVENEVGHSDASQASTEVLIRRCQDVTELLTVMKEMDNSEARSDLLPGAGPRSRHAAPFTHGAGACTGADRAARRTSVAVLLATWAHFTKVIRAPSKSDEVHEHLANVEALLARLSALALPRMHEMGQAELEQARARPRSLKASDFCFLNAPAERLFSES